VVVGSGAGGGAIALDLERKGKEVLVLERGPDMP
jgi:choline dehydrogenase-like flavoprotein